MTWVTLALSPKAVAGSKWKGVSSSVQQRSPASNQQPETCNLSLAYFAKRVGAESATLLQVGTPFDYQRQMKFFVVGKMPDPREDKYREALRHWIEHFVRQTHGK